VIVVDTNIIGYLFLENEHSAQAEQALRRDLDWAAPLLWRSELRNVLTVQARAGRLGLPDALEIIAQAERLMRGREYAVASSAVLRLAAASGCTAYDCEFVALAQDLGAVLVTVDRQVLARFPEESISLENYASL
jgi:predicted nucleic acid-binding protein